MADRSDKDREDESSTLGGASRLGAEGGKGTVGASGAGREGKGPSSQPVSEGIEGSILDDATDRESGSRTGEGRGGSSGGGRSTGIGSEASEGIHAAQGGRDQSQRSSVESAGTGQSGSGADVERTGSEPLHGRTREHQSGYGGAADRPKTSSDQREPLGDEEAGDGM